MADGALPVLTLAQLDGAGDAAAFAALLDGVYEHSPWVAEQAWRLRPPGGWPTVAALKHALATAVRQAGRDRQLALLRAHPDLAGKAMVAGRLTAHSTQEQGSAGLAACTPEEFAQLGRLNADYGTRFGWPFILAVRGPNPKPGQGLTRAEIIATFERRLGNPAAFEFAEALRNVHRIAELRLAERMGMAPRRGARVCDRADALAAHSDPGHAERGELTVTYLTDAHRACARQLAAWMAESGCDDVHVDAVGNVVGVYFGAEAGGGDGDGNGRQDSAPRLLTGSHYDTVRNAGRHDGRLGILVALEAVAALHGARRRLPFGIEVVAFAEEEGQRWNTAFLASSALVGRFDPAWLGLRDAGGVALRDAMAAAGLPGTPGAIAACRRDPARYLGFVEVHIEQGPVLDALDLPLGVVTSINGSRRLLGRIDGTAAHAGTTPMAARHDAACAAAELALSVERRARSAPDAVGTVGLLHVPAGSVNVVPGRCEFSLDLRAPTDAARDALAADVRAELDRIAAARGVRATLQETLVADAAPSAPAWQARWEAAVRALGLPVHRLPSGAGHDAMKLHELLPQAMLFVRCGNGGISHNPLETVTADDAELAVAAFDRLLEGLAADPARNAPPAAPRGERR